LIRYLDTSVLVSGLTPEPESQRIAAWIATLTAEELVISDWVVTEFSAALSIKLREKQIDEAQRAVALAAFSRFCIDNVTVLSVSREQFHAAAGLATQYAVGLRAADALHLAICADYGATLCTLDRRLSTAGTALGITTLLV
jgi:predicted nucleic acid-binding protein